MQLAIEIKGRLNGTYQACCPALPGCKVLGLSREDAESKIAQAIEGYLASLDVALPPREIGRMTREPPRTPRRPMRSAR